MNRLAKILIPVVLVATAASGIVYAQQMRRERHTPETMQRLQDGRIAMTPIFFKPQDQGQLAIEQAVPNSVWHARYT